MDDIVAVLALEVSSPPMIRDDVVAGTAKDHVVAVAALEPVVAVVAIERVVADARDDRVIARGAAKDDMVLAGVLEVVAYPAPGVPGYCGLPAVARRRVFRRSGVVRGRQSAEAQ